MLTPAKRQALRSLGIWLFGLALGLALGDLLNLRLQVTPAQLAYTTRELLAVRQSSGAAPPEEVLDDERNTIEVAERNRQVVVAIGQRGQAGSSAGSGFFYAPGRIVTNQHVIDSLDEMVVTLPNGQTVPAQLLGADASLDLAALAIDPELTPAVAAFAPTSQVRVGQKAIAIGHPFNLTSSVTSGIVSAIGRQITARGEDRLAIPLVIQTDAAINPGNSGGPLLDSSGRVLGVNTMILSDTGTSHGVGFAIPADLLGRYLPELETTGRAVRPYLGISMRDLSAEDLAANPAITGIRVEEVQPGTAAQRSGLRPGDIITAINGQSIARVENLLAAVLLSHVGDTVQLTVLRGDQTLTVLVTLGAYQ
ncbi:MAG: trypsin-like peptidase domain-containing protein [Deinococcus sp.]|nr:trypsin-like peptidase domain-containing protein [Deinococcus sp.]